MPSAEIKFTTLLIKFVGELSALYPDVPELSRLPSLVESESASSLVDQYLCISTPYIAKILMSDTSFLDYPLDIKGVKVDELWGDADENTRDVMLDYVQQLLFYSLLARSSRSDFSNLLTNLTKDPFIGPILTLLLSGNVAELQSIMTSFAPDMSMLLKSLTLM